MSEYNKYIYKGPVLEFDKLIAEDWYGETMATSEKKAKSNFIFIKQSQKKRKKITKFKKKKALNKI